MSTLFLDTDHLIILQRQAQPECGWQGAPMRQNPPFMTLWNTRLSCNA